MMLVKRLFFLTGLFFLAGTFSRAAEHTKDGADTIKKALAEAKAVLVDVREKSEWEEGHLQGAKLVPLSTLKADVKAEVLSRTLPKDKIIYCHCAAGGRCLQAAEVLQKLGYDVRPIKLGYKDLVKAGFMTAPR